MTAARPLERGLQTASSSKANESQSLFGSQTWRMRSGVNAARLSAGGMFFAVGAAFGYNGRLMLKGLIDWYLSKLATGGYPLIALLMTIESSIVPLPSELIIPPAAHLAYTHQSRLGLFGIVLAGTAGSWLGATLMYWASRFAGRPLVLRYGRFVLISPEKVAGVERWSAHYGSMGIFISRLLPVVRHLIGIPAGIVRMNYRLFSLYTVLGSGLWCAVLCYVGIKMGEDQKLMQGEAHQISLWLGAAMLVLGGIYYFFVHRQMKSVDKGE